MGDSLVKVYESKRANLFFQQKNKKNLARHPKNSYTLVTYLRNIRRGVAQLVAHSLWERGVVSSSLATPTIFLMFWNIALRTSVFSFVLISTCLFFNFRLSCNEVLYNHLTPTNPNLSIHILKVNPNEFAIKYDTATIENGYKAQTTSTIAAKNSAIAAINGSFFDLGEANHLTKKTGT